MEDEVSQQDVENFPPANLNHQDNSYDDAKAQGIKQQQNNALRGVLQSVDRIFRKDILIGRTISLLNDKRRFDQAMGCRDRHTNKR